MVKELDYKLEDLHRFLQFILSEKGELERKLRSTIINNDSGKRTALNLAYDYIGTSPFRVVNLGMKIVFGIEFENEFNSSLSFVLEGVKSENEGMRELGIIAIDLQRFYSLSYKPRLYKNGILLER